MSWFLLRIYLLNLRRDLQAAQGINTSAFRMQDPPTARTESTKYDINGMVKSEVRLAQFYGKDQRHPAGVRRLTNYPHRKGPLLFPARK
jgi:hypothetical protein